MIRVHVGVPSREALKPTDDRRIVIPKTWPWNHDHERDHRRREANVDGRCLARSSGPPLEWLVVGVRVNDSSRGLSRRRRGVFSAAQDVNEAIRKSLEQEKEEAKRR